MESSKQDHKGITKGRWQWKSNPNPWSQSEKPQWKSYSLEQNYLIEKAYYDQQKEVDIGDYIVSIQHMIQKKKGAVQSQRSIRRVDFKDSIKEIDRSERYFETEMPKTVNRIFGNLRDFLDFFSRRSLEILNFASQFEKVEESNDLDILNQKIVPQVIHCLEEEVLKPFQEQLKDPSLSELKKKVVMDSKENHEKMLSLFQREFQNFEEFYWQILRAYTMETCLYKNLNKYLRNEDWIKVDNLLPYAFCLCKVFFNFKFDKNWKKDEKIIEPLSQEIKSITLFRGTAIEESALNCYHSNKHFSWNSVTSASKNEEVGKKFMYMSEDIQKKKYPVMFIIEIPLSEDNLESERLKCIDIHQYSEKKEEDEVILAPGSVFELIEISTDKDRRTTIKLKLKSRIQALSNEGLIMYGAWQSRMMTEKEFPIVGLEGEELYETLRCLAGNKLIEKVEFCLCVFDNRSLKILTEILPTLERAEGLKFISCTYQDSEKISSLIFSEVKGCKISQIEISEVDDFYKLFTFHNEDEKYWMSLSDFRVNFRNRVNARDGKMDNKWLQGLKYIPKLESLTLDFSWCSEAEGPYPLSFEGLENLTELTSLTLKLSGSEQITDEGLLCLASQALGHLKKLKFFAISLYDCRELTDKGMYSLAFEGLKRLNQLTSLSLDFRRCPEITNQGFGYLASEGFGGLTQLTSLTLYFNQCSLFDNPGLQSLASEGLKHLTKLKFFSLRLSSYYRITDEGVKSLAFEGLRHLTQLTSLTLRVLPARLITKKGFSYLAFEGLKHLVQLTSLDLDFTSCDLVSDEGVRELGSGLQNLTKLTSLALRFSDSNVITNYGVSSLASEGLSHLPQLESLSIDLSGCTRLEDEALHSLGSQGLQQLTQLTSLALYFSSHKITEKGLEGLACEGLGKLVKLTSLTLRFANCSKIPDEGISILGLRGLKNLTQLASLTLDFPACEKLTDEGVDHLASFALNHLVQMVSLTFNVHGCNKITDKGVHRFTSQLLKHLDQFIFIPEGKRKLRLVSNSNSKSLWKQQILEPPETKNLVLRRVLGDHKQLFPEKDFVDVDSENCPPQTQEDPYSLEISSQSRIFLETATPKPKKGILQPFDMNSDLNAQKSIDKIPQSSKLNPKPLKITDEELSIIASEKLKYLTQLRSLSLNFERCHGVTDKGIHSLVTEGLNHLTQLRSLSGNFEGCNYITDKGVQSFAFDGLQNLHHLTSLSLDFKFCYKITRKGVQSLAFDGFKHLNQLTSLSLDFRGCFRMRNAELRIMASEGLKNFPELKSLTLCYANCKSITDHGLKILASQGLKHLNQLTSLSLDFSNCILLTGLGLQSLAAEGLKHLTQLTSLSLDFSICNKITDQGVSRLEYEGLRPLTQLTSLNLNFNHCRQITRLALSNILRVLYYFGFLML